MRTTPAFLPACLLACLVLGTPRADAYVMAQNGRLDRLFWKEHHAPVVLAGRIEEVRRRPDPERLRIEGGPDEVGCGFRVAQVLLGPAEAADIRIELDIAHFEWPRQLVPLAAGEFCILVLDARALKQQGERPSPRAVVSARARPYERAECREAVLSVLESEILAALDAASDPTRQRQILLQLAPILDREHTARVAPYLASGDAWLRRAALGALLFATRAPGYLEHALLDLQHFLRTTGPRNLVRDLEDGVGYAPYPLWVEHFACLDTGWHEGDAVSAFLPLWREFAATPEEGGVRWSHGLAPLCRVGTEADLRVLWEAWRALAAPDNGEARAPAWHRQQLLLGLARILGLEADSADGAGRAREGRADSPLAASVRRVLEARGEAWMRTDPTR
jgi:hypothetical protein